MLGNSVETIQDTFKHFNNLSDAWWDHELEWSQHGGAASTIDDMCLGKCMLFGTCSMRCDTIPTKNGRELMEK